MYSQIISLYLINYLDFTEWDIIDGDINFRMKSIPYNKNEGVTFIQNQNCRG